VGYGVRFVGSMPRSQGCYWLFNHFEESSIENDGLKDPMGVRVGFQRTCFLGQTVTGPGEGKGSREGVEDTGEPKGQWGKHN